MGHTKLLENIEQVDKICKWFNVDKYKPYDDFGIWELQRELEARWKLLNDSPELYAGDNTWDRCLEYGLYTKIYHQENTQNTNSEIHVPYDPDEELKFRGFSSLRLDDLIVLSDILQQEIDTAKEPFDFTKDSNSRPDRNEPINNYLLKKVRDNTRTDGLIEYTDIPYIAHNQIIAIHLNLSNEELIANFRKWLVAARKKFEPEISEIDNTRLSKVRKSLDENSLPNLNKLKNAVIECKVIPYLDLCIYSKLTKIKITDLMAIEILKIDDEKFKKYTLSYSRKLMEIDTLRKILRE